MSESSPVDGAASAVPFTVIDQGGSSVGRRPTDALYRAMIENLPETSVTVFDRELRFHMAYGEALSFNGWSKDDLDGKTIDEVLPPDHLALLDPVFTAAIAGERATVEVPSVDGTRTLLTHVGPLREGGVVIGGVAISVDITERKLAEEGRRRLAAIVEQSDDAIIGITTDSTISAWNQGAERLYQYRAREAVGAPLQMLEPGDQREQSLEVWRRILSGETIEREGSRLRQDGTQVDVWVIGSPIFDADGTIVAASEIARDITDRKLVQSKLEHLADHDPLTGLLNRRGFETQLVAALMAAKHHGTRATLLMVDIDHFKYINDSYGHSVGDAILRRVANLIRLRLRETDIIARLGGDEFAVVLNGVNAAEAARIAETILSMLRTDARTRVEGQAVSVNASVGLTEISGDAHMTIDEVLAHADVAVYEAKAAGRDAIVATDLGSRHRPEFQRRLNWAERIRKALEKDDFVVCEQPILTLSTNQIDQRELLLRMRSERGDLVDASSFVPIAERFGQMQDIDRWVLRHALDTMQAANGHGDATRVHVNVSGASLSDADTLNTFPQWIAAANVDPRRLVFEITETAAIQTMKHAQKLLRTLTEMGCGIALDDFGSGFGSFHYLKQLPFDCMKIDGSFTNQMIHSETDRVTVRALVDMAHGLGKTTVAECIEDEATLNLVREFGFDQAQGFHIGRPAVPA